MRLRPQLLRLTKKVYARDPDHTFFMVNFMMDFIAGCVRLFNMTFEAAYGLDYFKAVVSLLVLLIGGGLVRLGLRSSRRM